MTANLSLNDLLHPRVIDRCQRLFENGHWPEAAYEAVKQVEIALKEKGELGQHFYGTHLVDQLLGHGIGIKLRVPLGQDMHEEAHTYFRGVFSYYRNYLAHDGSNVDRKLAARIMVVASDLLDLIGASTLSFTNVGGVEGLVKVGVFKSRDGVVSLLCWLDGQKFPHEVWDGMFEELADRGFSDTQLQAVFDLDLVKYESRPLLHDSFGHEEWDQFGWMELTPLGRAVVEL